jgi:hypothetical protein
VAKTVWVFGLSPHHGMKDSKLISVKTSPEKKHDFLNDVCLREQMQVPAPSSPFGNKDAGSNQLDLKLQNRGCESHQKGLADSKIRPDGTSATLNPENSRNPLPDRQKNAQPLQISTLTIPWVTGRTHSVEKLCFCYTKKSSKSKISFDAQRSRCSNSR